MKTTKKQFQVFKKECEKWLSFWGITDIDLLILHSDIGDDIARCEGNYEAKFVKIQFNTEWKGGAEITDMQIKETAFHEAIHVLLQDYATLAFSRFNVDEKDIVNKEHEIVHRITNAVFRNFTNSK